MPKQYSLIVLSNSVGCRLMTSKVYRFMSYGCCNVVAPLLLLHPIDGTDTDSDDSVCFISHSWGKNLCKANRSSEPPMYNDDA